MSLFTPVEMAPRDPILGLNEAFNADPRKEKINLGVGVYFDEDGKIPLLKAVARAEEFRQQAMAPRGYLPIEGIAAYDNAVQKLLFGQDSDVIQQQRIVTAQSIGGTGALKLGADFLKTLDTSGIVAISNPSWENHRALFTNAGYEVQDYRYYEPSTNGLDFLGMLEDLQALPPSSVVILHACCHNPTGVDLTVENWHEIIKIIQTKQHIPFLDIAYQGFGQGIEEDAAAVRLFAESGMVFFVSSSFSKSFSFYGERVGALSIVTQTTEEAQRVLSQVKRVIRTNYSNPPTHGATIVNMVLNNPELNALWQEELASMRKRIQQMRTLMVQQLKNKGANKDFGFIIEQHGMFSYTGLTAAQVERLREEFAIYAVSTGRICVAALNMKNIDAVTDAIVEVCK
ncbi:amino acid aminotransferase [Thiopseudomonas acetoxidans]|uniref:Aminotransferase n=1 Tax=Thiopseudomonas acetoxidans TaxID=3041622 RepID=A0ABT7SM97_9GAMM|nr:amino acid aminotransferase [Thiopseudomonas sp. CY1220]MDM7857298.1 amino acid aminotransferase [Thiopseudomonas sp. CY1220]